MPISSQAVAAFHQFVAEAICGASRRMNSRPARASSMRRRTCVPKYGAGLGLSTVAWISCKSSVGADVETLTPTDSVTEDMGDPLQGVRVACTRIRTNESPLQLGNLVEQFIDGRADTLEFPRLRHSKIRIGDVPAFGCDLVLRDPVRDRGVVNPGPTL